MKVIYQHCAILHSLGYEVYPLLMGEYIGNFFDIPLTYKKFEDVVDKIGENDIVVSTEFRPYEGLIFSTAYKIIFVQNFYGVLNNLYQNDKGKNYYELGYDRVITCSNYLNNYIYNTMSLPSEIITNGIDLDRFLPDQKLRNKRIVLALVRKNKADLDKIMYLIKDLDCEIKVVDNLTESELIAEYQSAVLKIDYRALTIKLIIGAKPFFAF